MRTHVWMLNWVETQLNMSEENNFVEWGNRESAREREGERKREGGETENLKNEELLFLLFQFLNLRFRRQQQNSYHNLKSELASKLIFIWSRREREKEKRG